VNLRCDRAVYSDGRASSGDELASYSSRRHWLPRVTDSPRPPE